MNPLVGTEHRITGGVVGPGVFATDSRLEDEVSTGEGEDLEV